MSFEPIIIGCTWRSIVDIRPTHGATAADVSAALDGSTVTARLYDGAVLVASPVATPHAQAGTVALLLDDATTAALTVHRECTVDLRIATAGGDVMPVRVLGGVAVVATSSG